MKIVKEAKIKISSVIENLDESGLSEGEAERSEICCEGFYHYTDGDILITYTQKDNSCSAEAAIICKDATVTVSRRGAIESELRFEEGVTHSSLYSVPPYSFDASIYTKRIRKELSERGGTIDLHYNMKIGGVEKSARMKIWISTN